MCRLDYSFVTRHNAGKALDYATGGYVLNSSIDVFADVSNDNAVSLVALLVRLR